jgi:4-hydroxyproline epimerase
VLERNAPLTLNHFAFVDSHTEGEPTRVLTSGIPDLGSGCVADQLLQLRQQDWLRRCTILEPRGWDALVGVVLCKPHDARCAAGVIFINNVGYLGMCGHGMIGLAVTLHHLGRIGLGKSFIETPVGVVAVDLLTPNRVVIENVPSYRLRDAVTVEVEGLGSFTGDVAWGGNWFFIAPFTACDLKISNIDQLTDAAKRLRRVLSAQGITGADGAEIDHIEFFSASSTIGVDSRNFVYCPGGAYDRSPCGTGTSAKVACLAADGMLAPGEKWIQESIIGSSFEASYRRSDDVAIIPRIVGQAFVVSEGTLIRQSDDPLKDGISQPS